MYKTRTLTLRRMYTQRPFWNIFFFFFFSLRSSRVLHLVAILIANFRQPSTASQTLARCGLLNNDPLPAERPRGDLVPGHWGAPLADGDQPALVFRCVVTVCKVWLACALAGTSASCHEILQKEKRNVHAVSQRTVAILAVHLDWKRGVCGWQKALIFLVLFSSKEMNSKLYLTVLPCRCLTSL